MAGPRKGGPGHMAVAMERVTGTHVVFGRAGGVWISHVATDPCLLGLTLVCTFSKPKVCVR